MWRKLSCGHFFRQERSEQALKLEFYCCCCFNNYYWNTGVKKPLSAQSLMNVYGSLEDNAEGNVDHGGIAREVSEDRKNIISN